MYQGNFRSEKIVCTNIRPPLQVSRGEILHVKHPHVSAVNRLATRTFREEKTSNNKAGSFFRLDFNVYTDVDNRERARAKDKKTREKKKEEHENFIAAVRKWEMQAATKVKISGSDKKVNRNTYDFSSIKRVTRKFLDVSRCSRAKQRQRNVQKSVLNEQSCCCWFFFFANFNLPVLIFFCRFRFRRGLALHDFIFCLSKL